MTDTLYVLHQGYGNDGALWCATWDGTTWTDVALGAGITGGPAVAVYNGVVHVFRQGTGDNQGVLLHTTCTNGVWSGDQSLGAGLAHNPAAVVYGGKLWVFHQDGDNSGKLFHMTYDGTSWSADTQIPLGMSYSPSATVYGGKLYLFHNGYDSRGPEHSDRSIWYSAYDGTSWGKDTLVLPSMGVGAIVGSPSVTVSGNDLFLFFCRSNDGSMSCWRGNPAYPTSWFKTYTLPCRMSESPAAVTFNSSVYTFHQGYGDDGSLWYVRWQSSDRWDNDVICPPLLSDTPAVAVLPG